MRIDHAKRCWLAAQIVQNTAKHCMLEDVSKIAGMKIMLIVQEQSPQLQ
jgi:hypothetical protein